MVNDAHLVGFSIAHAQPGFAYRLRGRTHFRLLIFCSCIGLIILRSSFCVRHFPVQTGFRFSRKDEMPSRKSEVVRMRALSSMAAEICSSSWVAMKLLMSFFVARTEEGLFSLIWPANSR